MTPTRPLARRTVLGVGLITPPLVLAACAEPATSRQRAADQPVLLETWASELALIAAYEQAIAIRPDLTTTLASIAEQHREHAQAVARDITARSPSAAPVPSASATPADLVAALRDQERAAAAARAAAAVRASGGPLAALLCLIGASEAQHVAELGGIG